MTSRTTIRSEIQQNRKNTRLASSDMEMYMGELLAVSAERVLDEQSVSRSTAGRVGLELEVSLVDDHLMPVSERIRDKIAENVNGNVNAQGELVVNQLEINQRELFEPGFSCDEIVNFFRGTKKQISRLAYENDCKVLSAGVNPILRFTALWNSDYEKYWKIPFKNLVWRQKRSNLKRELNLHTEPDTMCVGNFNAVQPNREVANHKEAVATVDRQISMAGAVIGIMGTGSVLEERLTDWNDPGKYIWNETHNAAGDRVLPTGYFGDVKNYFLYLAEFPYILSVDTVEDVYVVARGLNWGLSRPYSNSYSGVEFRALSTQPTPEMNAAGVMLTLGLDGWMRQTGEPLLPFPLARQNIHTGMRYGQRGRYHVYGDKRLNHDERDLLMVSGPVMKGMVIDRAVEGLVNDGHGGKVEIKEFMGEYLKESFADKLVRKLRENNAIKDVDVDRNAIIDVLHEEGALF